MSHELRTPLVAILGYTELIQEGFYGPLADKGLDSLTRIRSNGKHLLGPINTVLDVAKIESGQFIKHGRAATRIVSTEQMARDQLNLPACFVQQPVSSAALPSISCGQRLARR